MTDKALLVGAGDLGIRIGRLLHANGADVWAMRRQVALVPSEFHAVRADLADPESIRSDDVPDDLDTLVFVVTADERTEAAYRRTYVDGLSAVVAVHQPRRLIVVSSTAVYHQDSGEWVDETSPADPTTFSGQSMLAMERVASQHPSSSAVRLAGVYGPGRERLVGNVRDGLAAFGSTPTYTNRIHVDDAAALVLAVAGEHVMPSVVLGVDDDPADRRDVIEFLAARLSVPVPEVDDDATRGANKRCRNELARSLGWEPEYPSFREGYDALLGELG